VTRQLVWDRAAIRDLAAIARSDRRQADRIEQAAEQLAQTGYGDVVKLTGSDLYRLRVGNWRVIFEYSDGGLVVLALRVLRRNEGTYR
jgi:mRNA-degrading endonuclease RelE of RelBE toxin-antitoxin system